MKNKITAEKETKANDRETDTPEDDVKRTPLATRSLPRRCLSVEGATTNYKTNLAPPLRPPSIYLEMENGRRGQSTRTRRYRSNYPVGK